MLVFSRHSIEATFRFMALKYPDGAGMMNARSCRCCSWNNTIFIIFQFKMMRWQQLWRSVSVKLSSWLRNKRKRAEREFACVIIPSSSHHTVTGAQQTEWKGGERKRKENILAKPFFLLFVNDNVRMLPWSRSLTFRYEVLKLIQSKMREQQHGISLNEDNGVRDVE